MVPGCGVLFGLLHDSIHGLNTAVISAGTNQRLAAVPTPSPTLAAIDKPTMAAGIAGFTTHIAIAATAKTRATHKNAGSLLLSDLLGSIAIVVKGVRK